MRRKATAGADPLQRRPTRLPRRGHYLLSFGPIEIALGALTIASATRPATSPAGEAARQLAPPMVIGPVLIGAGVLALAAIASRRVLDRPGDLAMAGLMLTATWSAASYVWAIVATAGDDIRMATAAAVWLLLARVHHLVSGWPEPPALEVPAASTKPIALEQLAQVQDLEELTRILEQRGEDRSS